jgi:hypothetical protein
MHLDADRIADVAKLNDGRPRLGPIRPAAAMVEALTSGKSSIVRFTRPKLTI